MKQFSDQVNRYNGFNLIEVILAITIFAIVISFVISGSGALVAYSKLRYDPDYSCKLKAFNIFEFFQRELEQAMVGSYPLYDSNISKIRNFDLEFKATNNSGTVSGSNLRFSPSTSKPSSQQLFLSRLDYRYTKNLQTIGVHWEDVLLSERIIYLDKEKRLRVFVRTEKLDNSNKVTGEARITDNTFGKYINPYLTGIEDIQFFFWGNNNKAWDDDGTGSIVDEWDSTIDLGDIHKEKELPHAILVVVALNSKDPSNPIKEYRKVFRLKRRNRLG